MRPAARLALTLCFLGGCGGRTEIAARRAQTADATCENGLAQAAGPAPWVITADVSSPVQGYGYELAPIAGGDILWLGNYREVLRLGVSTVTTQGDATFLARLSPQGAVRWLRSLPTEGFYQPSLAASGAWVMVSSTIDRQVDFGTGWLPSQGLDAVLVSLDATTGAVRWAERVGGEGDDYGGPITQACDGSTWVSRLVGTVPQLAHRVDGQETAVYEFPGNGLRGFRRLVAADDSVLVAGDFYGKMQAGGVELQAGPTGSGFCALIDGAGNAAWGRVVGEQARAAAAFDRGNVVVAGVHTFPWSLDGHTFELQGRLSSYVVRLDAQGALVAAINLTGTDWVSLIDIAASPFGVDVVGAYTGELQIGNYHLVYVGPESNQDIFVVRLSSDLSVLSAVSLGGSGPDQPEDVRVDTQGQLLVTGYTRGGWTLGGVPVPTVLGDVGPFLLRFAW